VCEVVGKPKGQRVGLSHLISVPGNIGDGARARSEGTKFDCRLPSSLGFNPKASRILKGEGIVSIVCIDRSYVKGIELYFAHLRRWALFQKEAASRGVAGLKEATIIGRHLGSARIDNGPENKRAGISGAK
jgi:hypothetical protein